ncbi:hypothetical protein MPDQ_006835 [Monascus purpureus]|uniref:Rab-GAP TBC domain-containing protein n=1 Tax=Monascus purpureus TaxID=5098 RepID=A0A507QTI1_MONPU|nr:hypothetical protein MPDQ_006835 [Monascus purpureus]
MVQRRVRSASVFPHLQQPLLSLAIFSPLNDKDYGDMRTIEDARQRWDALFRGHDTISDLRNALKSEQGTSLCSDGLRSICWKAILLFDDLDRTQWQRKISDARGAYSALREHFLKYIENPVDLSSTVDPLADDEESPWQTLRRDETLRAEIYQDVDRCLQENPFFCESATKARMLDILFIYSKLNPDLGYRQGMHELLAPILWVVDHDAIDTTSLESSSSAAEDNSLMLQCLDGTYIEHDSFMLFCCVMQTARIYYEYSDQRSENGSVEVIPIVSRCQHIHEDLLAVADRRLAEHLQAIEVLPQIFLTRWLRLLFGREFPFDDVLTIWDILFADGLRADLVDFICVAMLLRVHWQLLDSDYSTALSLLLRYPSPQPHAPSTLVYDGLYLEQNPSPGRGKFLISKYSGKPPESPKHPETSGVRSPSARKAHLRRNSRSFSGNISSSRSSRTSSPKNLEAFLQDVSEGIHRRTESWGVAKAVRGAVNEARKNIQSVQAERSFRGPVGDEPTMKSQGASSINESNVDMKRRVEYMERRNKELAKSLSQALDDIRPHLMNTTGLDASTNDAMREAFRRLQFVQACLEDSLIPIRPADKNAGITSTSSRKAGFSPSQSTTPGEASSRQTKSMPADVTANLSSTDEELKRVSTSTNLGDEPSYLMPLRSAPRLSLADSGFSWMLGGSRHLSGFVSSSSVTPEQARQNSSKAKSPLFNSGEEEQKRHGTESDGLAMSSLRGSKER